MQNYILTTPDKDTRVINRLFQLRGGLLNCSTLKNIIRLKSIKILKLVSRGQSDRDRIHFITTGCPNTILATYRKDHFFSKPYNIVKISSVKYTVNRLYWVEQTYNIIYTKNVGSAVQMNLEITRFSGNSELLKDTKCGHSYLLIVYQIYLKTYEHDQLELYI